MKQMLLRRLSAAAMFCLYLLPVLPAAAQQTRNLYINGRQVSAEADIATWLDQHASSTAQQLAVRVSQPWTTQQQKQLSAAGLEQQEYLGNNLYLLLLTPGHRLAAIAAELGITGIVPYSTDLKISAYIQARLKQPGQSAVLVSFFPGTGIAEAASLVQQYGGRIIRSPYPSRPVFQASFSNSNIRAFAALTAVQYISRAPEHTALDQDSKGGEGAVQLNMPAILGGAGLTGKGMVIGHGDNASGIYHVDQEDRVINYNPAEIAGHGVLTAGIIGGDGIMDPAGQGIATDATLVSHFFSGIVEQQEAMYQGHNMTITNNSYTAVANDPANAGVYDILSVYMDDLAFSTPEVLDVFAAGNDGRNGWNGYPAGYANVCGGYQPSKNTLVVGALYRSLLVGEGSSRGPVRDGRLKPEMTAMGMDILCPIPDNTYTITRGTSLSCPQVAGGAALIAERYKALHSGANPRSDLLKAIMMNGTSDLGNRGPDFLYGFGLMNLRRSLEILEQNRYTRSTLSSGSPAHTFTITVPAGTAQLKVMLYYHDPAASPASATQLVNDLDLSVTEPGGTLHRPLILDPSIAGVGNLATEGADHLNNVEQVTVNNPAAGSYTVAVAPFSIPAGPQEYVLVYDFVPDRLELLYPVANAASPSDTALYIYWDAPYDAVNTLSLEYSVNNGSSWLPIASGIAPNTRNYKWTVPPVSSAQCKVRVSRGSANSTSGTFVLNKPPVVSLQASQCPGSIAVNWTAVPGADKYYLLIKDGPHMRKADSVTAAALAYTFRGLRTDTRYFVAVQPSFSGMDGYRSLALIRRADSGDCATITHGDLALVSIDSPGTGRRYTSSALSIHTPVRVRIGNRDNLAVSNFTVSYQVNGGAWTSYPAFSVAANKEINPIIEYYDFSNPGTYELTVAVHNNDRPDPVSANDTLRKVFRQLPNDPVSLLSPLENNFEAVPDITLHRDSTGFTTDDYWDYHATTDSGRLRSRIPGSHLVTSAGSISLDLRLNSKSTVNYLDGTFNLAAYDTSVDELRFDFDYEMRGMPLLRDSNKVWARGADTDPWIPVYTYEQSIDTDDLHQSGTLSLKDILSTNGQNFSASTQLRFGQFDSTVIADDHYGGGLSLDNIRLYKVQKDISLDRIISPAFSNCDMSSSPLSIMVRNGTTQPAAGITVSYILDGGSPFTEIIPGVLGSKDSIAFTFSKILSGLSLGTHSLSVWLHLGGDDYLKNDSILQYRFVCSPLVGTFPYLEDFESGEGNWYSGGINSSWAYGRPASAKVTNAASGTRVWKTNLSGNYRDNEQSFLYSPCFNTAAMDQPMLSFSAVIETEYCSGGLCDEAHMEYSTDNEKTWHKLGAVGDGTNWYNEEINQVWSTKESTRWHVASISLPKAAQLKLRFVLRTDPGTNMEGVTVDDVHIFDRRAGIADAGLSPSVSLPVTGSGITDASVPSGIIASLLPEGHDAGTTLVRAYGHSYNTDKVSGQYLLPRSLVILPERWPAGGLLQRLYVTDREVLRMLSDTTCTGCTRAADAYRSGVSGYTPAATETADSLLPNNTEGIYRYYPYTAIRWVPYDNGYYAEFRAAAPGEFWFNDGGITGNLPVNTLLLDFKAQKLDETTARLDWSSAIDTAMLSYRLERSFDSLAFDSLTTITAKRVSGSGYTENDQPGIAEGQTVYYRLFCSLQNGKTFYSVIRALRRVKGNQLINVYPVPSDDGTVHITWTAQPGSQAELLLCDMTGRTVFRAAPEASGWENEHLLHIGSLSKGLYFLKMTINGHSFSRKILFR